MITCVRNVNVSVPYLNVAVTMIIVGWGGRGGGIEMILGPTKSFFGASNNLANMYKYMCTQGRRPPRALELLLPKALEGHLPRALEGPLPRALEGPLPRALEGSLPRALESPLY